VFGEYKAQLLIATHSYALISSLFPENIFRFALDGTINHPTFPTFLANERAITLGLFQHETEMNYLEREFVQITEYADRQDLKRLYKKLGEGVHKLILANLLAKRGR
jgi:hypothetical protein